MFVYGSPLTSVIATLAKAVDARASVTPTTTPIAATRRARPLRREARSNQIPPFVDRPTSETRQPYALTRRKVKRFGQLGDERRLRSPGSLLGRVADPHGAE